MQQFLNKKKYRLYINKLTVSQMHFSIHSISTFSIWTVYFESGVSPFDARKYALF